MIFKTTPCHTIFCNSLNIKSVPVVLFSKNGIFKTTSCRTIASTVQCQVPFIITYIHTYMHIHIHIYTYIHIQLQTYIHTVTHIHTHIVTHMHTYIHTHTFQCLHQKHCSNCQVLWLLWTHQDVPLQPVLATSQPPASLNLPAGQTHSVNVQNHNDRIQNIIKLASFSFVLSEKTFG